MEKAIEIIKIVAGKTDRVILFHSASGKDSIALLDLISPYFKEVVCVYMYLVKDLSHINRYINYAAKKYPNVKYIQIPHFSLYSYRRIGYMGCVKNEKQKLYNLAQLTDIVREKYGIEWAFYGFKQSDSMNRRLMLRTYDMSAINEPQKKCYPLSEYKNKDVLRYIDGKGLIKPEKYVKSQSSGTDITDTNYLLFLRDKYPNDLQKVIGEFPLVERKLFEYNYERDKTE
jgi:sulfate adenylyltransferase subunit 2